MCNVYITGFALNCDKSNCRNIVRKTHYIAAKSCRNLVREPITVYAQCTLFTHHTQILDIFGYKNGITVSCKIRETTSSQKSAKIPNLKSCYVKQYRPTERNPQFQ